MTRTIAISTNKGGVLKTSVTTNLAGILSQHGKVLIIDTDNQGNVAVSFGESPDRFENTIYDVMMKQMHPKRAIVNVYENIDILPSNDDMEFFEFDVLTNLTPNKQKGIFHMLEKQISRIREEYDYILIDTPPNLGLTHGNALTCAHEILIPFQPEVYSMRSLAKILKSIDRFRKSYNINLKTLGVVATLVDLRTTLHSDVLQECKRFCYENNVNYFDTIIPRSIRYPSTIAYERVPATLSKKNHEISQAYYELGKEIFNA